MSKTKIPECNLATGLGNTKNEMLLQGQSQAFILT